MTPDTSCTWPLLLPQRFQVSWATIAVLLFSGSIPSTTTSSNFEVPLLCLDVVFVARSFAFHIPTPLLLFASHSNYLFLSFRPTLTAAFGSFIASFPSVSIPSRLVSHRLRLIVFFASFCSRFQAICSHFILRPSCPANLLSV